MNRIVLCAAALLVVTATGAGQPAYFTSAVNHTEAKMRQAEPQYLASFGSDNQGVVESALAHAVWMKLCVPDREFISLRERVNSLAATEANPVIRTKAYLACLAFDKPELFEGVAEKSFEGGDELFAALNARLQYVLLTRPHTKYVRGE